MGNIEEFVRQRFERSEDDNELEDALRRVGLKDVEAPLPDTPAYEKMQTAAEGYIQAVASNNDGVRRRYHDDLCVMIAGEHRDQIDKDVADKISDFAAYLTGHDDYIGTW